MPEATNSDPEFEGSIGPPEAEEMPELNCEEWGNGDVVLSDDEGRWIQADEEDCIHQDDWV